MFVEGRLILSTDNTGTRAELGNKSLRSFPKKQKILQTARGAQRTDQKPQYHENQKKRDKKEV